MSHRPQHNDPGFDECFPNDRHRYNANRAKHVTDFDDKSPIFRRSQKPSHDSSYNYRKPDPTTPDIDSVAYDLEKLRVDSFTEFKSVEDILGQQRIQERPSFIECSCRRRDMLDSDDMKTEWTTYGTKITWTDIPDDFFDAKLISKLQKTKHDVMNHLTDREKRNLRSRANPYDSLKNVFFSNRDGPKIAALDAMFDFAISGETDVTKRRAKTLDQNKNKETTNALSRMDEPFYFVDIGSYHAGYSEYFFWRKGYYNAKGFITNSTFENSWRRMLPTSIGLLDVFFPSNVDDPLNSYANVKNFVDYVHKQLENGQKNNKGVDFVGCFDYCPAEVTELNQEIQNQKKFLGNCLTGLTLLRVDSGNMLVQAFDVFTPVSVGILYCLYLAFERIAITKPVTSRPGNSEKFIFCQTLTPFGATIIKDYFEHVLKQWDSLPDTDTVFSIVPTSFVRKDTKFFEYFVNHCNKAVERQIKYLQMYGEFSRNLKLATPNGEKIRRLALAHFELPPFLKDLKMLQQMTAVTFFDIHCTKNFDINALKCRPTLLSQYDIGSHKSFHATECIDDSRGFALVVIDGMGTLNYLTDPKIHLQPTSLNGPAFSIFLIDTTADLFDGKTNEIVIHDAAILVNDDISSLPLTTRLKCIEKFVATGVFSFGGKTIRAVPAKLVTIDASNILENDEKEKKLHRVTVNYESEIEKDNNNKQSNVTTNLDNFWNVLKHSWLCYT